MNRKNFLSSTILASGTLFGFAKSPAVEPAETGKPMIIPPYLKPGDVIGITSPAGFITADEIKPAIQQMENWGFKVKVGQTIGKRDFTFGGTDAERANDLQEMMDDNSIKAIMCARGGYGMVRIIDNLNFSNFKSNPKWIIGFSDITVMHSQLSHMGIASVHSKMCNSFPDNFATAEPIQIDTILSISKALKGEKMRYEITPNEKNVVGIAEGVLVGGNLKTIESLAGSASDIKTEGKILFVEDTGEYLYSIDRMFWNLKRTGKLNNLAGLIVGGFKIKPDDPGEAFGKTVQEIVTEKIAAFNYPVCFDFPVGHQKNNFALKCGIKHRLEIGSVRCSLQELN
ncbi:S66 peptidase family protein [Pinibacter soli]|uniref:LD-carboxypeptidase n=1 Tax=Pinibacter soli TaxID=3044211 RepID=A0ABT6R6E7_9BACT|nr:LD-carboxypeptidase [Pinibacter soli]MDI3318142.1 LD-carboxypeptidase [Pinibacter soli]